MSLFLRRGLDFIPTSQEALDLHNNLPAGNYIIKENPMTQELYFEQTQHFPALTKLYGNTASRSDRILQTFLDRAVSTGVLLTGEKGSGKTLLAKLLAIKCHDLGFPTIIINSPWKGDRFNKLIQDVNQPCVVFFDEFEKVYDHNEQEQLLTLLDGVFPSKKLFILTCNDKYRIDKQMQNRPGRLFYKIDFKGLEQEFIREYCHDVLNDTTHIDVICRVAAMFEQFNFDILKALVEEMNRYNENPFDALEMLNATPMTDHGSAFDVALIVAGREMARDDLEDTVLNRSPVGYPQFGIEYYVNVGDDRELRMAKFTQSDITRVDPEHGIFVYSNPDGDVVTLTRQKELNFSYRNFMNAV